MSKYAIEPGSDRFFLDETTPGVRNGYWGWYGDLFDNPEKFTQRPFSPKVFDGLIRCANAWKEWYNTTGGPTDPPDESATDYDYLSESTLYEYITRDLKCDPLVAELYSAYTIDCMGGTADIVNAHTAISFLASEYAGEPDSIFAPPGGTSFLAARLNDWLRNSGVGVTARRPVDVKLGAVALRVDERSSAKGSNVNTIYYNGAGFSSVTSRAAVVATPPSSSRHLVGHLFDRERQAAWGEFNTCPAVVANVAVRSMKPFVELGLGYANHMWGSKYWANFVIADWSNGNRVDDNGRLRIDIL